MSPRADGTFYNSWDRAQAHGQAWISSTDVRWLLNAPKGKAFRAHKGDEAVPWSMKKGAAKMFKTFTEATAWAEEHFGITGWERDRWGSYHPSETAHDVARDGVGVRACNNRRKPGETLCGVHLAVKRRAAEQAEAAEARAAGWRRDRQLRADCRAAAEPLGIPIGSGDHVQMHAEDFLALCRELTELREMREMA